MRLFIAIPLTPNLKTALAHAQTALQRRGVKGNFTPKENNHLTLAFIGETMTVEWISLFRSDRGKNGMIYTELGAVKGVQA